MNRSLMIVILVCLLAAPAAASEDPAADLARCRKLVKDGKWDAAAKGYAELFRAHEGSPVVVAAAKDVEDDLKAIGFRTSYEPLCPKDFFGKDIVKSFGKTSLKAVLVYEGHLLNPRWEEAQGFSLLDVRWRDYYTIEVKGDLTRSDGCTVFLLCWDVEKQGGYMLSFGSRSSSDWRTARGFPFFIWRMDAGKKVVLKQYDMGSLGIPDRTIIRDSSGIRTKSDDKSSTKVKDRKYKGGFFGLTGPWPDEVKITGRVDPTWWKTRQREHENRAFTKWLEDEWIPARTIPEWVRSPVGTKEKAVTLSLPLDAVDVDHSMLFGWMERALDGDPEAANEIADVRRKQGPRTKRYLAVFQLIQGGRYADAKKELDALIGEMPAFAPALALRGFVHLWLRRTDRARADFDAALAKDPAQGWAHVGHVVLAIHDGDLEAAEAALARAKKAGARSKWLEEYPDIVHRAKRGPLWSKVYSIETSHFRISSDHSTDLCRQTANLLESAMDSYAMHFPDVEIPKRKARVYVFANQEGYLGYASSVAKDLTYAAGAYDPSLRELVLYLPLNRKHFVHTIRHEGFHRFLHEYLARAPLWFNEGCAEYFASSRERFSGGLKPGAVHADAVRVLRARGTRLTPLPDLLRMPRAEFMRGARVHYPQSWALVHFLHNTKDARFRELFRAYFRALRAGRSEAEAYDECFAGCSAELEKAYRAHIRSVGN